MKRILVVMAYVLAAAGCQIISYDPPYTGPLWGDSCLTDKGPRVVSGCTHPSDGTGDPGWGSEVRLGLCAPPSSETLATMDAALIKNGYTGACRPFCDITLDGTTYTCPANGVPTYEIHTLHTSLAFCYCADPDVDAPGTPAN